MRDRLLCLCLMMYASCDFARAQAGSVHIDAKLANRTICQLEFSRIENLVVAAKYVSAKSSARASISSDTARALVEINYAGVKMRVHFGTAIRLDNVRSYDLVWPVNTRNVGQRNQPFSLA